MPGETLLNQRYELVAQQGSGGMSVIYRARDRSLGRTVAIKVLRPTLTQDPAFLDKFQQEARSVANDVAPQHRHRARCRQRRRARITSSWR